jgi:60 kDa SS-A/Ro ribonucleoprotein
MSFLNPSIIPQSQPLSDAQVPNNGGGFVYKVSDEQRVLRFIILGSDSPTYYCTEQKMTEDNAKEMIRIIKEGVVNVLQLVEATSLQGRAPRQTSTLFLLALLCTYASPAVKSHTYVTIKYICRTGTHLFQFVAFVNEMRGWSDGLRRGVAAFYEDSSASKLVLQILKYRQRHDFTHRDVLRLCHPKIKDKPRNDMLRYAVGREVENKDAFIQLFEKLQESKQEEGINPVLDLISCQNIPWEFLPTWTHKHAELWQQLLPTMGYTAMLRNITKMAHLNLFPHDMDSNVVILCRRLTDENVIKAAKVHPMQIFFALKAYERGIDYRDPTKRWCVIPSILAALNQAFQLSFQTIKPTGKNYLIGIDVSGSMDCACIANSHITAREAAAVLALVIQRTEPNTITMAFSSGFIPFPMFNNDTIQAVVQRTQNLPFSSTDCALPILFANQYGIPIDCFITITDNETNSGRMHPSVALKNYREKYQRNSKNIVIGTTSTGFTVADPVDPHSIDIVGFDSAIPTLIADFVNRE